MNMNMSQTVLPTAQAGISTPQPVTPTMRHSANLWQLTLNELYKLRKRRLVWGLLLLDLFFVFAAWLVLVFYAMKSKDGFEPGHLLGGINALSNSIGQPMTLGRRGGEFIAVALGGLAFGGEFSSGAIRLVLSRGVNRVSYLLAKYIALSIACLALVIASLLMSLVLTNFLLIIHQPAPTLLNLDMHTLLAIFGICVGTFENFLLCLLLGSAVSIIARSAAFGIAAGFGYLIGEDIAAQILPVIGRSLHIPLGNQLNNLLFTTNLNAFYANALPTALARGLDSLDGVIACNLTNKACVTVSVSQSFLVVVIWALVLASVSTYLFVKRDVLQ